MALRIVTILVAAAGCACAAPSGVVESDKEALVSKEIEQKEDLLTDASSSYGRGYSDWGGYPSASSYSGYGVTGYGTLDDKYNNYNSYYGGYGGYGGYDSTYGYNGYSQGSPGYSGYAGSPGYSGYAGSPGYSGYAGNPGYSGYSGYNDYGSKRYGGYGLSSTAGNGGYGGYGGNGGLLSYYGYNNPYNQGSQHLGFGYYNKRPGNIYNSGVTPSLVTGYRGYTRR